MLPVRYDDDDLGRTKLFFYRIVLYLTVSKKINRV